MQLLNATVSLIVLSVIVALLAKSFYNLMY